VSTHSTPTFADDFLHAEEVARVLRVHPATVIRLIRKGRLSAHRVGGKFLISRTDFDAFIEGCRTTDRAAKPATRSPSTRRRAHERAEAELEKAGV
jgi:excisionase family DNA binding protein